MSFDIRFQASLTASAIFLFVSGLSAPSDTTTLVMLCSYFLISRSSIHCWFTTASSYCLMYSYFFFYFWPAAWHSACTASSLTSISFSLISSFCTRFFSVLQALDSFSIQMLSFSIVLASFCLYSFSLLSSNLRLLITAFFSSSSLDSLSLALLLCTPSSYSNVLSFSEFLLASSSTASSLPLRQSRSFSISSSLVSQSSTIPSYLYSNYCSTRSSSNRLAACNQLQRCYQPQSFPDRLNNCYYFSLSSLDSYVIACWFCSRMWVNWVCSSRQLLIQYYFYYIDLWRDCSSFWQVDMLNRVIRSSYQRFLITSFSSLRISFLRVCTSWL